MLGVETGAWLGEVAGKEETSSGSWVWPAPRAGVCVCTGTSKRENQGLGIRRGNIMG